MAGVEPAKTSRTSTAALSSRLLSLLEKSPARKQEVHLLRTTIRRLEVQLGNTPSKIAKALKDLRKKAGRVRDIDVHLGLLKSPLLPKSSASRDRASVMQDELRQILKAKRERHLDSLHDALAAAAPLLQARLPVLAANSTLGVSTPALHAHRQARQARDHFLRWTRHVPEDAIKLHQLRIQTKKLRYSLEPLEAFPECVELAAKLKQVQDAIGRWHDWATLSQLARHELHSGEAEPLCAALSRRSGSQYRRARRAAESARRWMAGGKPAASVSAAPNSMKRIPKAG
ncbi:MAG: CHAD domain-containing protein [Candidatus Korobacteraceae bacterium]|jgi:CHAD domain-containing protein